MVDLFTTVDGLSDAMSRVIIITVYCVNAQSDMDMFVV